MISGKSQFTRAYNAAQLSAGALAILLLAGILSPVIGQQQIPFHYLAAYQQAQEKRIQANQKLQETMEDACDWIIAFRLKHGHFPELGVEQDQAIEILQKRILKANPYSVTGVQSKEERRKPCALRFQNAISLNEEQRKVWEKTPPSDWRAEPGTLTIICDQDKNLFIWGAGADQSPIRDYKNNKCIFAWRELE